MKEAYRRGLITCADLHTGFDINGYHKDYIENAHILFYSSQGLPNWKEMGVKIQSMGPGTVICMMGEEGCAVFENDGLTHYPAACFTSNIVDSVGAGDAMVGAYLSALSRDLSMEKRIRMAQISGLYACTSEGSEDCYINYDTMEEIAFRR